MTLDKKADIADWAPLFRGKRIMVTGDTGFKGSWLCLWLHDLGAEVTGLGLPPEHERGHFRLLGLERMIRHVTADVRDYPAVKRVFDEARPQIVFHLAAQALVRRAYADPKTTFDTNIGGSVNLLEAVRQTPSVRSLVYITSDKCYLNQDWPWGYRETDRLGGEDPYGASKGAAEIVFAAYAASYFGGAGAPGLASTRAGNVIGGGDWSEDRLVPDCIRAFAKGNAIVLRKPEATRPWQHVLEPLSGYLQLAASLYDDPRHRRGSWNFGPPIESGCPVGRLAEKIVAAWGSGSIRVERPENMPPEDRLLHLNTDKARLELGWRTRWSIDRTVTETVEWYKAVGGGAPAIEVSRAQIKAYGES